MSEERTLDLVTFQDRVACKEADLALVGLILC